jgi:glycosyltransferase involved in cell wall biosynthesis
MNFYIKHFKGVAIEGGAVRNEAFYQHFRSQSGVIIKDVAATNIFFRIVNALSFIAYFRLRHADHIFMHMGGIFVLFPTFIFKTSLAGFVFNFLGQISKNHNLHIEVNDLPYEQSRDLQLPQQTFFQSFQRELFKLKDVTFHFASVSMRKYAVDFYGLKEEQCQVLINGSDKLSEPDVSIADLLKDLDPDKLKYVYVGSLNRGRQIEDLIAIYAQVGHYLLLLGPGGEWIDHELQNKQIQNIKYLGTFSDQVALQISSLCDVGVIPYDDSRFYYNMCYPTKVSFYLAAGLPILCTKLVETQQVLSDINVAQFLSINKWKNFISENSRDELYILKQNVLQHRHNFYWSSILKKLKF